MELTYSHVTPSIWGIPPTLPPKPLQNLYLSSHHLFRWKKKLHLLHENHKKRKKTAFNIYVLPDSKLNRKEFSFVLNFLQNYQIHNYFNKHGITTIH